MKKRLQFVFAIAMAMVLVFSQTGAFAADAVPSAAVWFTPPDAAVGAAVTLNALVYNNGTSSATVTVTFATPTSVINTATATISAASAKTFSVNWAMPSTDTVVTATVTKAVGTSKNTLTPLLGTIGTVTVGTATVTSTLSLGTGKIVAWLNPILASIEAFRVKNAALFAEQRDEYRVKLGLVPVPPPGVITQPETPAPAVAPNTNLDGTPKQGVAAAALGNPTDYFIVIYSTAMASLFGSQVIFYIVLVLLILLVLRFIVNLIF